MRIYKPKDPRPDLSPLLVKELWARAAGRCEFRGCNKILYRDDLTKARSNLAVISHIVAYEAAGPRGDNTRSKLLAREYSNLMLTCRDHGKVIDDLNKVEEYPEERLVEFKNEHEQRIRILTNATEESQTFVVFLKSGIDGKRVSLDQRDAFTAILPKYSAEEQPWIIDLGNVARAATIEAFPGLQSTLLFECERLIKHLQSKGETKSISVFAIAPVSLLVLFGHQLGNLERVELFQYHRSRGSWKWPQDEDHGDFYTVTHPADGESAGELAILLSISATVKRSEVTTLLGEDVQIFELAANTPGTDFLSSGYRLEQFGIAIRSLLNLVRDRAEPGRKIHVFAAVPAPIAVLLGICVQRFFPPLQLYEYLEGGKHVPVVTIP